jgi:hypothetical protein
MDAGAAEVHRTEGTPTLDLDLNLNWNPDPLLRATAA